MKKLLLFLFSSIVFAACVHRPKPFSITLGSTHTSHWHVMSRRADGSVYFNAPSFTGGDTLVFTGTFTYANFVNLHGTDSLHPIVILNDGDAKLAAGTATLGSTTMWLSSCSFVKVLGSGNGVFEFTSPGARGGVGIQIDLYSHDIEIVNVYIHHKAYGTWAKNEMSCDTGLARIHLYNISMHDCVEKDFSQHANYWGSTDQNSTDPWRFIICNGDTLRPLVTRLANMRFYNNIIDSCGRSGHQVSGCDSGYNLVYNNRITNCGLNLENNGWGAGIAIGGYSIADVHDNYVRYTTVEGIYFFGKGLQKCYNNDVDFSGYGYVNGTLYKLTQKANYFFDTRPTTPLDTTQIYFVNNKGGTNTYYNLVIFDTRNTISKNAASNVICSNSNKGDSAFTFHYFTGFAYSTDCAANVLPLVNAGADTAIKEPQDSISITGSATDADGSIAGYRWTKASGPACNITDSTHAVLSVNKMQHGKYVFRLAATDNSGAVVSDDVAVTVRLCNCKVKTRNQ